MTNAKIIRTKLKRQFDGIIFSRGEDYYNLNNVLSVSAKQTKNQDIIKITGRVAGTYNYNASFSFDFINQSFFDFQCDCPYDDDCKHEAALGLELVGTLEDFFQEFHSKYLPKNDKHQ